MTYPTTADGEKSLMLQPAQFTTASSVTGLLSPDEASWVLRTMGDKLRTESPSEYDTRHRTRSVHSIEGLDLQEVKQVYEPAGRLESEAVPTEVRTLLDQRVAERMPTIRRNFPDGQALDPWIYVSYGPGQHITPHVDYPNNESTPGTYKICGISLALNEDFTGGEFFIETHSEPDFWIRPGRPRPGADMSSEWFRVLPRTRWRTGQAAGSAVLYGSCLVHGTEPVVSGRVHKLLTFVVSQDEGSAG